MVTADELRTFFARLPSQHFMVSVQDGRLIRFSAFGQGVVSRERLIGRDADRRVDFIIPLNQIVRVEPVTHAAESN